MNLYAYVRNSPLVLVDPLGLAEEGAAIGAVVGAGVGISACGAIGAGAGAVGGTLVAPGVGTVGGAVGLGAYAAGACAAGSAIAGAVIGSTIEDFISYAKEKGENEYTREAKTRFRTQAEQCKWLDSQYKKARKGGDSQAQQKIKAAQKYLGCRRSGVE